MIFRQLDYVGIKVLKLLFQNTEVSNYINPKIIRENVTISCDMIDFDKVNNNIYDEDEHSTTDDQYLVEIEPINEDSEEHIAHASFTVICAELFNSLKGNFHLMKFIIGLILEVKEIITSKKEKISIERLTKQTNRFKTMFTTLKKKSIFN